MLDTVPVIILAGGGRKVEIPFAISRIPLVIFNAFSVFESESDAAKNFPTAFPRCEAAVKPFSIF